MATTVVDDLATVSVVELKIAAFAVVVFGVVVAMGVVWATDGVVVGAWGVVVEVEEVVGTTSLTDCDSVMTTSGVTEIVVSGGSSSSSSAGYTLYDRDEDE